MNFLMPQGGPTPTTRIAGRGLCLLSYALSFLVSTGDLFIGSSMLQEGSDRAWLEGFSIVLGLLSVLGFFAVVAHRWRIEWVPATAITFLLLARCVPVWISISAVPAYLSTGAMMTLGALCLGKRALDLWVFSIKTKQSAELSHDEPR